MSPEPELRDEPEDLTPLLEESLHQQLWKAIERVQATEAAAFEANKARKAARNRLAELLQGLGVTGFSIGS